MSALQKKLLFAFALIFALQTGVFLIKYLLEVQGGRFGGDFICFWQAAQRVRHGDLAAIYDPDGWRKALESKPKFITWMPYPPFTLALLWPLGNLTYNAAVAWWSLAPLPVYAGLVAIMGRRLQRASWLAVTAITCAFALPFLSVNLFTGQIGAVIAILFLAAAYFWTRRPILAGICIGLLAVKPQMGVLIPFALLAAGQWRTIWAAGATIIALVVGSVLWLGAGIWGDYARLTQLFGQVMAGGYNGIKQLALGPYVAFRAADIPVSVAVPLQAVISLTVVAVTVHVFWRGRGRRADTAEKASLRMGVLAAGTLLATPYTLFYDTPLLVLALLPLLSRAWRQGWDFSTLLAISALMLFPYAPSIVMGHQTPFGAVALALTFGVLYRRYRQETSILAAPARPSGFIAAYA
jgi:alpha-1,2-mannosyltransferase